MRKILSVALTCVLTCTPLSSVLAAPQADAAQATAGAISGSARSAAGAPLSKLQIRVLDAGGALAGSGVTAADGAFTIAALKFGTYTVQCVGERGRVLGTASVMVTGPTTSMRVTCSTEAMAWYRTRPVALLAGLGAAAVAIGAVAVVATGSEASGAR